MTQFVISRTFKFFLCDFHKLQYRANSKKGTKSHNSWSNIILRVTIQKFSIQNNRSPLASHKMSLKTESNGRVVEDGNFSDSKQQVYIAYHLIKWRYIHSQYPDVPLMAFKKTFKYRKWPSLKTPFVHKNYQFNNRSTLPFHTVTSKEKKDTYWPTVSYIN